MIYIGKLGLTCYKSLSVHKFQVGRLMMYKLKGNQGVTNHANILYFYIQSINMKWIIIPLTAQSSVRLYQQWPVISKQKVVIFNRLWLKLILGNIHSRSSFLFSFMV